MRILFVTPYIPSPIRARSFNLIKCLSHEHTISLVSLLVDSYERMLVKEIEPYCISVDLVPLPKRQSYMNCLRAIPTLTPLRIAYYHSPTFIQHIKEVIEKQRIDLIHGELIKVAPALKAVMTEKNIPILYDSVDCMTWFLEQKKNLTRNALKKFFAASEFYKMRLYERHQLSAFKQIIISSSTDRNYMSKLINQKQNIQVIGNSVDTDYFLPWNCTRESNTLVFCAKLDYSPNAEGIIYFCKNILPLVWKQLPCVHLTIVGHNAPPAVQMLARDERITLTGYVHDIRPYLATASIAIAPLLVAAGTQFKILQALAMNTPVVTTPRCSMALGTLHGVHLLAIEEPQAYANAVVQLLNMPHLAQQLASAGRQFVIERYSWTSTTNTLNELYRLLVAQTQQRQMVPSMQAIDFEGQSSVVIGETLNTNRKFPSLK